MRCGWLFWCVGRLNQMLMLCLCMPSSPLSFLFLLLLQVLQLLLLHKSCLFCVPKLFAAFLCAVDNVSSDLQSTKRNDCHIDSASTRTSCFWPHCLLLSNNGIILLPYPSALLPFCWAGGDQAQQLLGPAGHLLTPAPVHVRLLQDPRGTSKSLPTN